MNNKSALNIVGILLLYTVFVVIVLFALQQSALGPAGEETDFMAIFQHNALVVLGVSFACMVVWFALGEGVIRAWAPAHTWTLTWLVLLIVTIGTAIYMSFLGPRGLSLDPVNYTVASYYLILGVASFYVSSVCFSPTNAKYAIWPAKHLRRW